MRSTELFSGAGGLGIGLAKAGFKHEIVLDIDPEASETLKLNQRRGHPLVNGWDIRTADIKTFDFSDVRPDMHLLAGGVPCQPFSIGGTHKGKEDPRNLWPWAIEAVRNFHPKLMLWENVKNFATSHTSYIDYIEHQLSYPEITQKPSESETDHLRRIVEFRNSRHIDGLWYRIARIILNAADLGIPQKRERVFLIGIRSDIDLTWIPPTPTHSQDQLYHDQWISGSYWNRHNLKRPDPTPKARAWLSQHNRRPPDLFQKKTLGHRTIRDATADLGSPDFTNKNMLARHTPPPRAAKAYKGHTGSVYDEPSKTLRAGDHGVSGGENMIDFGNDTYRHYTTREAARLMTFPDDFDFPDNWSTALRLLGNAVPVDMSYRIATTLVPQ